MHIWLIFGIAVVVRASTSWDPCYLQCKENFESTEQHKQVLISTCNTGCKLFSESFETTSECQSKRPEHQTNIFKHQPRVLPVTSHDIHLFKVEHQIEPQAVKKVDTGAKTDTAPKSGYHPSNSVHPEEKNANKIASSKSEKQTRAPASKTTVEPTSQPVQDHPVEASRQTTTTNGPRRENTKVGKGEAKVLDTSKAEVSQIRVKHSTNSISKDNPPKKPKNNEIEEQQKEKQIKDKTEKQNPEWKERVEAAKHCCRHECVATFKNALEHESCVAGCNLQGIKVSLKETTEELELGSKSPLGMFKHVVFNLASHVGKLIRISWSWVSSGPHSNQHPQTPQVFGSGTLGRRGQAPIFFPLEPVFVQEEARRRIEKIKMAQDNAVKLLSEEFFRHPHFEGPLPPSDPFHNSPRIITILKKETITHPKNRDNHFLSKNAPGSRLDSKHGHFPKLEDSLRLDNLDINSLHPDSPSRSRDNTDQQIQHQLDLLECISRKSGLPRWFIAITIFTSAIVVLWLCFSLTAPPDDIKVVKTKPPELETLVDEDDEYDDDDLSCSEKKKLLARVDDVIKIRIENV